MRGNAYQIPIDMTAATPRDEMIFPKNTVSSMMVYFTSYENGIARGELKTGYYKESFPFYGVDHLLLLMDDVMDSVNYPQTTTNYRHIEKEWKPYTTVVNAGVRREVIPFSEPKAHGLPVRVFSRDNARMQGEIVVDGNKIRFRSGMELTRLIHEYLSKLAWEKSGAGRSQEKSGMRMTASY
jgi:hypothetical protein